MWGLTYNYIYSADFFTIAYIKPLPVMWVHALPVECSDLNMASLKFYGLIVCMK